MSVTSACTSVAKLDSAVAAAPIVAAVGSSVAAVTAVLTASYAVSTASMPEANSDFASVLDLVEVALEGREPGLQLGEGPGGGDVDVLQVVEGALEVVDGAADGRIVGATPGDEHTEQDGRRRKSSERAGR